MARAKITSLDALADFRASLIRYLSKARPALEEVSDDVMRLRQWLETEQRTRWENEVRRRKRTLEEAQGEYFSARLSTLREATTLQQMAVHKAERALREAEGKLAMIKKWNRDYENQTAPLTRQLDQLHTFLTSDMKHAVAYLAQVLNTLEAYTSATPTAVSGAEPAAVDTPEAGEEKGAST